MNRKLALLISIVMLAWLAGGPSFGFALGQSSAPEAPSAALGTAITYQGRLEDAGSPAEGSYDLRFILYNAEVGGAQVGPVVSLENILVSKGYFTVQLDFGASSFGSQAGWLEVAVRPGASTGAHTVLNPRQALTPAPFARYAVKAGSIPWGGLSGVPAGFADGIDNDTTYTAGTGLSLGGGAFSADTAYLQRRVSGTCAAGSSIRVVNTDGTVTCETDDNTTYTAGNGLTLAGGQFSVKFAGSGSATTAAHSDHNHLGQKWTGSDNALSLGGSFNTVSSPAPLVLNNTTGSGIYVDSAGSNGVEVASSGGDGVYVQSAGTPSATNSSTEKNGFEVTGAEGDGLFVGQADADGVHVKSAAYGLFVQSSTNSGVYVSDAGTAGLWVTTAGDDGVHVNAANNDGVYANTSLASGEWGFNTNDKIHASNVTLASLTLIAQVSGQKSLSPGDLASAAGLGLPLPDSREALPLVQLADGVSSGVIGVVESRLVFSPKSQPEGETSQPEMELHSAEGPAKPGDYVALRVLGVAQVRVDASAGEIQPGMRLTAANLPGQARSLKKVEVGGVQVAESAPVIGVALSAPDENGLVWVLVNPQ